MTTKPLHARPLLLMQIRALNRSARFFKRIADRLNARAERITDAAVLAYCKEKST